MDLEDLRERAYTFAEDLIDTIFDFLEEVVEAYDRAE